MIYRGQKEQKVVAVFCRESHRSLSKTVFYCLQSMLGFTVSIL